MIFMLICGESKTFLSAYFPPCCVVGLGGTYHTDSLLFMIGAPAFHALPTGSPKA